MSLNWMNRKTVSFPQIHTKRLFVWKVLSQYDLASILPVIMKYSMEKNNITIDSKNKDETEHLLMWNHHHFLLIYYDKMISNNFSAQKLNVSLKIIQFVCAE